MKEMHRSDVENALAAQSSSSYGSLDVSSCSNLQRKGDEPAEESNGSGGLSMHMHDAANASAATSAANDAIANGESAAAAAFGCDEFQSKRDSSTDDEHHPAHEEHLVKSRQYYRDMVLGVNDGLVSTFLLVAGVVGGGMDVSGVLLTAISGAIAGAISMFAGEYVATKSQNEVMTGEIKLEQEHIKRYHAQEMEELTHLLSLIGLPTSQPHLSHDPSGVEVERSSRTNVGGIATTTATEARKLRRRMIRFYASNPDALLKIMIALEFGVIDEEVRSPFVAGGTSLVLFFLGALPSTVPFACVPDATLGLIISGVACGIGLFIVGAVKTWATRGNMWMAACENLLITAAGGAVAYGIGVGFQSLVGE